MNIVSVENRICGSKGCDKEAKKKVDFELGFSAGFCENKRIYSKKHRKRSEVQERPNKPFKDAMKENQKVGLGRNV